ncbi:MAG: class I SAM-dependent methyltransferase [Planctomycetota bacterium]|jgi:hypothetical protein
MDLTGKKVWDLSLNEIEYVYRKRHMNHHVYAALKTYHTSSLPLNQPVCLRPNTIPRYLSAPIEKLLELSPRIGKYDPTSVRADITYYTYLLYSVLNQVQLEDVPVVAQLLAACAYLAICSEKNDNLPLWNKLVIRQKNEHIGALIEKLLDPAVNLEKICAMPLFGKGAEETTHGDMSNLFRFVPKVIFSTVVLMENGDDPQIIKQALLHAEQAIRTYEQDNGCSDTSSPIGTRYAGQLRYRNTIYLYGGMFFEKLGWHDLALDWYLKDINIPELPKFFGFYLTDMKTTERLISAYPLTTDKEARNNLKQLIHKCLAQIFQNAAKYSLYIIDYLKSNPSCDKQALFLIDGKKRKLYAGEASREVYLTSLLYNKFILGIDYKDVNYTRFFKLGSAIDREKNTKTKGLTNTVNPKIFNRTDLINYIIETKNYKSYLEIGCFNNHNYDRINATVKVGVDPKNGGTIRETSDDFFNENNQTFDLIFIDGLHHSEQVAKDVDNSLKILNQNGMIVLHDCNPLTEDAQKVPRNGQKVWNGNVWRAVVEIRTRLDVDIAVGDFDYGCAVLLPRPNSSPLVLPKKITELSYSEFESNRNCWLRLMDAKTLIKFIG